MFALLLLVDVIHDVVHGLEQRDNLFDPEAFTDDIDVPLAPEPIGTDHDDLLREQTRTQPKFQQADGGFGE